MILKQTTHADIFQFAKCISGEQDPSYTYTSNANGSTLTIGNDSYICDHVQNTCRKESQTSVLLQTIAGIALAPLTLLTGCSPIRENPYAHECPIFDVYHSSNQSDGNFTPDMNTSPQDTAIDTGTQDQHVQPDTLPDTLSDTGARDIMTQPDIPNIMDTNVHDIFLDRTLQDQMPHDIAPDMTIADTTIDAVPDTAPDAMSTDSAIPVDMGDNTSLCSGYLFTATDNDSCQSAQGNEATIPREIHMQFASFNTFFDRENNETFPVELSYDDGTWPNMDNLPFTIVLPETPHPGTAPVVFLNDNTTRIGIFTFSRSPLFDNGRPVMVEGQAVMQYSALFRATISINGNDTLCEWESNSDEHNFCEN